MQKRPGTGQLFLFAFLLTCTFHALVMETVAAEQVYRIERHSSPAGLVVRNYYLDLLDMIMRETEAEFGPARIVQVPYEVSQIQLLTDVEAGRLDMAWTATSIRRERIARPIRIPLDMGLTGQRALVIARKRQEEFAAIRSLADLRRFTACQGEYWPDNDVLRAAGLTVREGRTIDEMYPLLRTGECDYLPRALTEIDGEVGRLGGDDLMAFDRLLLVYPLPMYIFVANNNFILAKRLTHGLEKLVERDAIRHLLEEHPSTRVIFPLSRYRGAVVIRLDNPDLPPLTPVGDRRLWLDIVPYMLP